ncbi:hypothetical protein B0T22DRAFT_440569 [Podospora appendiculata]|uniref:Uncharacterized protein n=1 Tax=Podospora appendiculata TaxID=314037 RepID=A0AAE0XAW1_9PEZI|nr:hypothetical protein B0T22DRAFT_440569 [Podospora appendiculata]
MASKPLPTNTATAISSGETTQATTPDQATPQPATDPRIEQSVAEFQTFISFIFSVSIFGASTFAVIVRTFLAVSWLCFILSLAVAGYSSSLLFIWRQRAAAAGQEGPRAHGDEARAWEKSWDWVGIPASVLLHLLLVTAFLFLSMAMVAYVGAVGWVAVGCSSLAVVFVLGLSGYQCVNRYRVHR